MKNILKVMLLIYSLMLFCSQSQAQIGELVGHFAPVFSVSFSPDGKLLASGSADNTITKWDIHSRQHNYSAKWDN